MLCIVRIENGELKGWIIATDVHDARRRAQAAFDNDLAQRLSGIEFPTSGRHDLGNGYTMLVQ
jgi:hypothetical protein